MKKRGFTLIELLAVIVVLAIIAIIAIPIITSVIDKAKVGALKDSAYGILEAGELYLAKNMSEGIDDTIEFTCSNGKCINGDKEITYKGQIETGRIRIYSDNKIELCITDNKNSALKKVTDKEVEVTTGTCNYDELSYDVSALVSKDDYDKVVNELNDLKNKINSTTASTETILEGYTAYTKSGLIVGVASDNIAGGATYATGSFLALGSQLSLIGVSGFTVSGNSLTVLQTGTYKISGYVISDAYRQSSVGIAININGLNQKVADGAYTGAITQYSREIQLNEGDVIYALFPNESNFGQKGKGVMSINLIS